MTEVRGGDGAVRGTVRIWLRAEGFAVLAVSLLLYWMAGTSWWMFFALLLTPDVSMMPYLINPKLGCASYNIVHSYVLPLCFAAASVVMGGAGLPYVLIWTAHIGLDRLLGYGLKYPTAFKMTHLGDLAGRQ